MAQPLSPQHTHCEGREEGGRVRKTSECRPHRMVASEPKERGPAWIPGTPPALELCVSGGS